MRVPRAEHADALDATLETGGTLRRLWQDLHNQRYVPEWFKDILILERRAAEIRAYEPTTIPGLLQTSGYARALVKARSPSAPPEEVEEIVKGRTKRLPAITENRSLVRFIIKEGTFFRIVGDETIMRDQLGHIVQLTEEGRIQVQALPDTPTSADPGTPFRVMALSDTQSVGYVEHTLGGVTFDAPDKVRELSTLFGTLQAEAHPFPTSVELIRKIQEDRYGAVA